jgi:hypothetical protein
VSPRIPDPPDDPIVDRLRKPGSPDVEDAIALIGYVGPGTDGAIRIYDGRDLQRFLEVPSVLDSQRVYPDDALSPSVVWVDRATMLDPIFEQDGQDDGRIDAAVQALGNVPFSTWNLIPETRYICARMLDLIPYAEEGAGGP